jgi:Holliday junction resolvase RusA-like endonuclease
MSEPLILRVPRELKSPNVWNGRHWRYKHRESQEWEQFIWATLAKQARAQSVMAVLTVMNALPPKRVCTEKRKVSVTRLVPSARNFIRDDDNLRFSVKPLLDALKRLGLIRDDNRKWIDLPMPVQAVSPAKNWATVIEIATVDPLQEALEVLQAAGDP